MPGQQSPVAAEAAFPGCRGDGVRGFHAGGVADLMPPGPALALLAADVWGAGLGAVDDDELTGVLRAARRLASWAAALELSAAGELMERRLAEEAAGRPGVAEHADDEIAAALTLTGRAAGQLTDRALAMRRLPATLRALAAGDIDLPRANVIVSETCGLAELHARAVELAVMHDAPEQTTGQLRAAVRLAVIAADPAAARLRKEQAEHEARVERWDEPAGTAGLAGRDLPTPDVLAADQHISALAGQLRAAGAKGSMDNLRAQVFLALLAGRSPQELLAAGGPTGGVHPGPADSGGGAAAPTPFGSSPTHGGGNTAAPAGPRLTGSVNLTVPLTTWLGLTQSPGEAAGFGPLDAADSRGLAALVAQNPASRWCLTITGTDGRPLAHGCARTSPPLTAPQPGTGAPPAESGVGSADRSGLSSNDNHDNRESADRSGSGAGERVGGGSGPDPPGHLTGVAIAWLTAITLRSLATGDCAHDRESLAYRPPPSLRHLIRVRHTTCSFPSCRRPAHRCDQDHTLAYEHGGRTCECNLAPLCRRHHRAKQTHGWRLDQPQPGVMIWTLPSGRCYTVRPTVYPSL